MDQPSAQIITAGIGITGTLSAALLTQYLGRRFEKQRRDADDTTRWLTERLRVSTRLLSGALALERDLWSACSHLDRDPRSERLPGHRSILLTPTAGLPGIIDEITREILVEAVEDTFGRLNGLEDVVAEISLIGTADEGRSGRELHECLWEVVGLLESFAPFDEAADAVERCRTARDAFAGAARTSLRVDGNLVALDLRPRG